MNICSAECFKMRCKATEKHREVRQEGVDERRRFERDKLELVSLLCKTVVVAKQQSLRIL